MVLLQHACVFFSRFLESRNYKIQVVAPVGRKSAVVLSGVTEASYSHCFIGIDFNVVNSRNLSLCKNESRKPPYSPRVRRPTSPRRGLLPGSCTSPKGGTSRKKHVHVRIATCKNITNKVINLHAIYSRILVNLLVTLSRTLVNLLVNTSKFATGLLSSLANGLASSLAYQ